VSVAPATTASANDIAKLGDVKMTIWSYDNQDPGLEPVEKALTANFMKQYPNVKINLVFKDYNTLITTVPRAVASGSGPDVFYGNQGYQIDGALVKAKLIIPLDAYAKAYGWDKWYSPSTWSMFQWSADGKTFGSGNKYGVASTGQNVDVFYNKSKLAAAGYSTFPTTFADFQKMMTDLKAKTPAGQPVIMLGDKDGFGSLHMSGGVIGAYVKPQAFRDWIFHKAGATVDTPEMTKALTIIQGWAQGGYFNKDAEATNYDDAARRFAKGEGSVFIGGNWDAAIVQTGLKDNAGVANIPGQTAGQYAGIGATSGPWHISSKMKYPQVGAAWLNYVISSPEAIKLMYGQQQIPSVQTAVAPAGQPYLTQVSDAWQQVLKANGLLLYPDWASDSMLQTLGGGFQKLIAGKTTPADLLKASQADWAKFDKTLH
jgi:raffinose/stachyose/melibiose transport system substrate-binding protein